jgi:hypothetical protein
VVEDGEGGLVLCFTAEGGAVQDLPCDGAGDVFTVAVDVWTEGVSPVPGAAGFAYAAVYQYDGDGELLAFHDFVTLTGTTVRERYFLTFEQVPQARSLSLRAGLYRAGGAAWFDDWTLTPGDTQVQYRDAEELSGAGGPRASVIGVFREPGFPAGKGATDPELVARSLGQEGFETRFVNADQLADPTVLTPSAIGLVVLPQGDAFPVQAADTFVEYLRQGGAFLALGGYAFDRLVARRDEGWVAHGEAVREEIGQRLLTGSLGDGGFESEKTWSATSGEAVPDRGWRPTAAYATVSREDPDEGSACARVRIPPGESLGGAQWQYRIPVTAGSSFRVQAAARVRDVVGPGFAYLAVYQERRDGTLVSFADYAHLTGTEPWQVYASDVVIEAGAEVLCVRCGIYQASGSAWFDDVRLAETTGLREVCLNSRWGTPEDGLRIPPNRIAVFDADYRLERVARVVAAEDQYLFPADCELGAVQGWAATVVRGTDSTRWIPLLQSVDRYGRSRGPVAALAVHYNGFFTGSAWAFCGIDDRDVFPKLAAALAGTVHAILDNVWLTGLSAEPEGVHPGEKVQLAVRVHNLGPEPFEGRVEVEVTQDPEARVLFRTTLAVDTSPGLDRRIQIPVGIPADATGLCRVRAVLRSSDRAVDTMRTGFRVLSPPAGAGTDPPLTLRDNYLRLGPRALFLFGTDTYADVYTSTTRNPLTWHEEHLACRDFGFQIYENLQYSNPGHAMTDRDWRRFGAMAQSTSELGLVFMPGMLIGHNAGVPPAQREEESRQCAGYAERLGELPRLLWYINGDYRMDVEDGPALRKLWQRYLLDVHGTPAAVAAAWDVSPEAFDWDNLPLPPESTGAWDAAAAVDFWRFRVRLMEDWNQAHVQAVREYDPVHPITSEYYSFPFAGIDLRASIGDQDLSNIGFFDEPVRDLDVLPLRLAWSDLRLRGKGLGLGEYGVKTHPAWQRERGGTGYHITRTRDQQRQLFLAAAHYTFGLGGNRIQNWCLRDADESVFPWGVFYPGGLVPKDVAYTHRNLSLFFRLFAPVYQPPRTAVLLCEGLRMGNHSYPGVETGMHAFAALLDLGGRFAVGDDARIDTLPADVDTLLCPASFTLADKAVDGLLEWVTNGGRLLLCGTPVFNERREPARAVPVERLTGVRVEERLYGPFARDGAVPVRAEALEATAAGLAREAWARPMVRVQPLTARVVLRSVGSGAPILTRNRVGRGQVVLCTDPLETPPVDPRRTTDLYAWFLGRPIPEQSMTGLHHLTQPTRTGNVQIAFNRSPAPGIRAVRFDTKAGTVRIGAGPYEPALAAVSGQGAILALEGRGPLAVDGQLIAEAEGPVALASLGGGDLRDSGAVLVLPYAAGRVRLGARDVDRAMVWGDVSDGRFQPLETLSLVANAHCDLEIDADRATLVGLVSPTTELDEALIQLDRLIAQPETTPGF